MLQRVQLGQEANKVLQTAAKAIDGPSHYHIELALSGIAKQSIKLWPLIPAFGAADAVIFVDMDNFAAHAAGDISEDFLILLIADPEIWRGFFHTSVQHPNPERGGA